MTDVIARLRGFSERHETALWLLLIICVAAALRFTGLTSQSYWFDELLSAWQSNPAHSYARVIELAFADAQPPLHSLAMWWSYKVLGYNEFAGRFPAALAGVAMIPVIYLLGRELLDDRTGLYAAALATPNFYLLYFAQEARSYALLCLLACVTCLFFFYSLRRPTWINLLLYAVATVALLYTHYFAFVMLAIQACIFLAYWYLFAAGNRQMLLRVALAGTVIIVALVSLVSILVPHAGGDHPVTQPPVGIAASYFVSYFHSPELALGFALLIAVAILAAGFRASGEQRFDWKTFTVLALLQWIALGFLLPWLFGMALRPVITDSNTVILVPPLLLLAALGLRSIPLLALQRIAGAVVLGWSLYYLVFTIDYYSAVRKSQFRELAAALSAYATPVPVYAVADTADKYNVYFAQSASHLRAIDHSELESRLEAGTAEPVFWRVSSLPALDTDIHERFELIQAARYTFRGTVAELLIDPRFATRVPLEQSVLSGSGTNWLSSQSFAWRDGEAQLLVALNREARTDPVRKVQVELLDVQGHLLESYTTSLGGIPSTLQMRPPLKTRKARLIVRMPEGEPEPEAWVIKSGSITR